MKKTIKSVMAMALALVLTASSLGSTAFAAASVSTTLGGHAATASIAERSDGAVATTRITGVTNAYTYAKLLYTTGSIETNATQLRMTSKQMAMQ